MRLLYPIFCVDKQTNMITVMKNRELASHELTVFFLKKTRWVYFSFSSEASSFLSLTAARLQRAELHKNLLTNISTAFNLWIFFF